MVKGLVIRQALTAVNLLFALVIAYVIYLAGVQQFGAKPRQIDVSKYQPSDSDNLKIAKVGARQTYDGVVNGSMFGGAGVNTPKPEETAPADIPMTQVTVPLKLYATVASFPTDPLATAIIENPNATTPSKVNTYYMGKMVTDTLRLAEVHRRRVIFYNEAKKQKEELIMSQDSAAPAPGAASLARGGRGAKAGPGGANAHASIKRQEMLDELNNIDSAELLNQLNPQLVKDDQGNVSGITSASMSSVPLAQKVGLQDNDVVQSVNGVQIDSVEKIGEIAQKFQNANTFRLSIMRDGKPQMLTFKVE